MTEIRTNQIEGVTASAAEINILDGATLTTTELNYVDGVTSAIQTQLNGKQASGSYVTVGGALGTPSSGTATNLTGTAAGLTAGDSLEINGVAVTGTPSVGQVPTATSGTAATWQTPSGGGAAPTLVNGYIALDLSVSGASTYNNGASGVGATITAGVNTPLTIDGIAYTAGNIVIINGMTNSFENGIYTVTNAGSGATPFVLTRHTSFDTPAELSALNEFVVSNTQNVFGYAGSSYWLGLSPVTTVGTTAINLGAANVTAGLPFGSDNKLIRSDGTQRGTQVTGITVADTTNNISGIGTITSGAVNVSATSFLTAQGAAIAATTLVSGGTITATTMFQVAWSATVTRAATTSCVLGGATGFQLRWTEGGVTKTTNPTTVTSSAVNATATAISGVMLARADAFTNLQYLMGYTSVGATTMQYSLNIVVTKLP